MTLYRTLNLLTMFDNQNIHACLDNCVTLDDAAKYSMQYINDAMLSKVFSQYEDYQTKIFHVTQGAIDKVLYAVVNKKKIAENVKSVLDDFQLYDGRADFDNKNSNLGRFVGVKFTLKANNDLSVLINKVSFQLDMPSPDLKLYLFSDDSPTAISTTPCNYNAGRAVKWFDTDIRLSESTTNYYLGYFETDLAEGAQSIKKVLDYVGGYSTCQTCGYNETTARYYQARVKYVDIQPFYIDADNLNGVELPDMTYANYVDQNNFGMNIHATVGCDITDFLCRNKSLLREPIAIQMAIDLLTAIMTSQRDNVQVEKAKSEIAYLLNGDKTQYSKGLYGQLDNAIDALSFDLSGINKVCLPCAKKPGLVYRGLR